VRSTHTPAKGLPAQNTDPSGATGEAAASRDSAPPRPQDDTLDGIWIPPILRTVSTDGAGVPELADAIERHAAHLHASGEWSAREGARLRSELEAHLRDELVARFHSSVPRKEYERVLEQILSRKLSPQEAVQSLLNAHTLASLPGSAGGGEGT
jgi:putative protein kinase ArgK-like GTPase of G3E family